MFINFQSKFEKIWFFIAVAVITLFFVFCLVRAVVKKDQSNIKDKEKIEKTIDSDSLKMR